MRAGDPVALQALPTKLITSEPLRSDLTGPAPSSQYNAIMTAIGVSRFFGVHSERYSYLLSFISLVTLPFREEKPKTNCFLLISLAAGPSFGDAILHLFPEIRTTSPSGRAFRTLAGIFSSFILEKFLRWRQEHGSISRSHSSGRTKFFSFRMDFTTC